MTNNNIKLFDVVALTTDLPEENLKRGQVGTVVEILADGTAFEVEFSDQEGRTYESLGLRPEQLTVFRDEIPDETMKKSEDQSEILHNKTINIKLIFASLIHGKLFNAVKIIANPNHIYLSGVNLRGANLKGVNLRDAILYRADLSGAILHRAILHRAILHHANLSGASLIGANLSGASLSGANLSGTNLSSANLSGADLRDAILSGANLRDAANVKKARFSNNSPGITESLKQYLIDKDATFEDSSGDRSEVLTPV